MKPTGQRILTVSGSLRKSSSNGAALAACRLVAPGRLVFDPYHRLASLPHFSPDLNRDEHPGVVDLGARVEVADAIIFSCPEYARGLPGAFKNALDWLVGGPEFAGKPVGIINASPRAHHAIASLRRVVTTMAGVLVTDADIELPLLGRGLGPPAIAADKAMSRDLRRLIAALETAIGQLENAEGV